MISLSTVAFFVFGFILGRQAIRYWQRRRQIESSVIVTPIIDADPFHVSALEHELDIRTPAGEKVAHEKECYTCHPPARRILTRSQVVDQWEEQERRAESERTRIINQNARALGGRGSRVKPPWETGEPWQADGIIDSAAFGLRMDEIEEKIAKAVAVPNIVVRRARNMDEGYGS